MALRNHRKTALAGPFSRLTPNRVGAAANSGRPLKVEPLEARLMMAADWGDAPAPYPTTLAENGPRHEAVGPQLGAARDMEADGAHSTDAAGDGADDDGIVFGPLQVGKLGATATVTVQGATATGAKLSAWIDFNGDGSLGGPGEQIADSVTMNDGPNVLAFDIPATAVSGAVIARFRLSTAGDLGVKGAAADGEVEDYAVTINPPARASGQFNAGVNVATQLTAVQSVVAVDVDDDGDVDVVSAAYGADKISWHRNTNGAFSTTSVDLDANGARSVFAADLNGDGRPDIISAAQLSNTIAWYEYSSATNQFTERLISSAVSQVGSVVAADVDADGDIDVVAAGNNRVTWFENNGAAVFTAHPLTVAGTTLTSVAVANVDGDGDLDILFASASDDKIAWYENNGSQSFTARTISTAAMGASSVAAADLDRDGDMDVLSASSDDDKIAWYENNGSEVFTAHPISTTAMGASSVAVGDIDGDGDLDVLAGSIDDNKVAWHQNNGSQVFTERLIAADANAARSVIAADLNGDGALDVLAAQTGNARVRQFQNVVLGDYDDDADVDGNDFLVWQRALGTNVAVHGSGADGNADGTVNAADLAVWRDGFPPVAASAVNSSSASSSMSSGVAFSMPASGFLTASLFDEAQESSSEAALLAGQSQQSASHEVRDAALVDPDSTAPAAGQLEATRELTDDKEEQSSVAIEELFAAWGL